MTREQAFLERIAGQPYSAVDYALPQSWVNEAARFARMDDILRNFVWLYPRGMFFGKPFPITDAGERLAAMLPDHVKNWWQ